MVHMEVTAILEASQFPWVTFKDEGNSGDG